MIDNIADEQIVCDTDTYKIEKAIIHIDKKTDRATGLEIESSAPKQINKEVARLLYPSMPKNKNKHYSYLCDQYLISRFTLILE